MRLAAALLSSFLLVGCAGSLPPDAQVPTGDASIYVVERGWHTDIGLPVDEIAGQLATLEHGFPGVRFMVFGFGERAYYMARRTGSAELLAAMFPSESAVLMTALTTSPTEAFADQHVVELHLPQDAVDRIANRIWQVLEKGPDGSAVRLADGPYPGSVFIASTETYDLFNTCNTWTAALLHDAGLPVDPQLLLADQVMQQVDRMRSCRRGSGADQQGGALPLGHTTVVPGGKTTVVFDAGGGGLLLLKLRQPASNHGRSNAIRRQHMVDFLATSRSFARTRHQVGKCSARADQPAQGNRVNAQISSPASPER